MEKRIKLQNVLLPIEDVHAAQHNLYYRGEPRKFQSKEGFYLKAGESIDFSSYFNCISLGKWKQYSKVERYGVKFQVRGDVTVQLKGYRTKETMGFGRALDDDEKTESLFSRGEQYHCETVMFHSQDYHVTELSEFVLEFPETDAILGSFTVKAESDSYFANAYYYGMVDEKELNPVCLSLVTTTFKKEEFIRSNIQKLKQQIFYAKSEIAETFYVHVIDNGRTLEPEEIEGYHIQLHHNHNTGGSGGYTRGMIETMNQEVKATHVLLMDDDVLMQPESIKRTHRLLSLLRSEYKGRFISGAMLYYEHMNYQHEDVGYVNAEGTYGPVKDKKNLSRISDCCGNELPWPEQDYEYAGWWYCCIPMDYVRPDNLPLPFFVRGDDVEYSLRNKARFITMNGICVWHMGFEEKYNAMMELYQVHRNSLMLQSFSNTCKGIDFAKRIKRFIRVELLRFNYHSVELLIDALEDYMVGPQFLEKANGEKIIKEKSQLNEAMQPLSELPKVYKEGDELYEDDDMSFVKLWLYRLSYNGLYLPDRFIDKQPRAIAYDWYYSKGRYALRKYLVAINPYTQQGNLRVLDKEACKRLREKASMTFKRYDSEKDSLRKQYEKAQRKLTSLAFWEKYLDL